MINSILDYLMPGDENLGMPPASKIDFHAYKIKYGIQQIVIDLLSEITKISNDKFLKDFVDLNEKQKSTILKEARLKNMRLFLTFLKHCFKAYYSDKSVLSIINAGSSPPFPKGNVLEEDDWIILMPVYERGSIYRKFNDDEYNIK